MIAGTTCVQFYFWLFARMINGPQVVQFLAHLGRYLRDQWILAWDRLPAQRSRLVQDYLADHPPLQQGWLPAYAPEFNPVEYLCPEHLGQL